MADIVFVDVEVNPQTNRLTDIGAVKPDNSAFHSGSKKAFAAFLSDAGYICGHNLLAHDYKYIKDLIPSGGAAVGLIDTLCLSALLFPKKPYHALLKDDKLQSDEINNPLSDAIKAKELFYDEVNAFSRLNGGLKDIFYALLRDRPEFSGFFGYIRHISCVTQDSAGSANDRDSGPETPCSGIPDIVATAALIRAELAGKICANARLPEIIKNHPIELAYCLALIAADDRYSLTPQWVYRSYPVVENVVKLLRNSPCADGCPYCKRLFDARLRLKSFFGYDDFRTYDGEPLQERATEAAVKNRSLLVIFPTAGGKSLTFQLPALIAGETARGLTVVISPLQSLMKDQVDNLAALGIVDAVAINGLLSQIERAEAIGRVANGLASILYISPESLRSKTIEKLLLSRNIVRFVIDEAHCFSSWGQEFRVDYLYIGDFIKSLQKRKMLSDGIPVSCFTATAKQKVISDIKDYFSDKLNIDLELFAANAERRNLRYEVLYRETDIDKYFTLRDLVSLKNCPTIVYVSRVKRTYEIAKSLGDDGFSAQPYNGRMEPVEKIAIQEAFVRGDTQIIVATSAFGMGVDKKDVMLVVHYEISDSLENYVQESGRAGRDQSLQAECYVLFNDDDLDKHFILLNQTKLSVSDIQQVWRAVKDMAGARNFFRGSPLEIARRVGWDENVYDVETRVKTAVSALETAGYLKRGMNAPHIYATSISVKTMEEASDIIRNSTRFNEERKQQALRIMTLLITSRSISKIGSDDAESRVDYISDILGIPMKDVLESVALMREEGLLADSTDMSAYVYGNEYGNEYPAAAASRGRSHSLDYLESKSKAVLLNYSRMEEFLISEILGMEKSVNLKEINGRAGKANVPEPSVKTIKNLLFFWIIKGYIKKPPSMHDNRVEIAAEADADAIRAKFDKRVDIAQFIIKYLFTKAIAERVKNDSSAVPFSILELRAAYENEPDLFREPGAIGQADVEDALFYLSSIGALSLEGGFMVLYSAMEITRTQLSNRISYKSRDYEKLNEFYRQKIQQIHIVGEYANMMVRDYDSALRFVNDYFQMEYRHFITKYFKEERYIEITRNITAKKFDMIFGGLTADQKKVIDDASNCVVVAAGPGSGKTRVLVRKLAALVMLEDVKYEQLLMLTFSRSAVTVFKSQLQKLIGNAAHFIEITTFHSYCFDLLGKVGNLSESDDVVKTAVEKINSGEAEPGRVSKTVVVIDEAQDMDGDEFRLIQAIMDKNDDLRIVAVGDDDQNIYEFRGSSSKYLNSLANNAGAKKYELRVNFRSKKNLVALANAFSKNITQRMKSRPVASNFQDNGTVKITKHIGGNLEIPVVEAVKSAYHGKRRVRATNAAASGTWEKDAVASSAARRGSVCVLTNTNDEALRVLSLLLKEGFKAKLIQSNEGFNLYSLAEFRFFMNAINYPARAAGAPRYAGVVKSPVISDDEWDSAVERLRKTYGQSECLVDCLNLLDGFARSERKKYRTDLEVFIRESKLDDFFKYDAGEIVVSTIHKSKGREFDDVFMLLDNVLCHTDECRRKIYVGMTRARNGLYIHYNDDCFDGYKIANVKTSADKKEYPQPCEVIIQLTHKDVYLGFYTGWDWRDKAEAIGKLRSGSPLACKYGANGDFMLCDCGAANIYSTGGTADTYVPFDTADMPAASAGVEVVRFSASFKDKLWELRQKGYCPISAKVRYIVAWRDLDKGTESYIVLPDITFSKAQR